MSPSSNGSASPKRSLPNHQNPKFAWDFRREGGDAIIDTEDPSKFSITPEYTAGVDFFRREDINNLNTARRHIMNIYDRPAPGCSSARLASPGFDIDPPSPTLQAPKEPFPNFESPPPSIRTRSLTNTFDLNSLRTISWVDSQERDGASQMPATSAPAANGARARRREWKAEKVFTAEQKMDKNRKKKARTAKQHEDDGGG